MSEFNESLHYLSTTHAEFPLPDKEWLRQVVSLKQNDCFQFYAKRLKDADNETVNTMLNVTLDNNALRELLGEVRGLRRMMWELNADETKLQVKLKEHEQTTKES